MGQILELDSDKDLGKTLADNADVEDDAKVAASPMNLQTHNLEVRFNPLKVCSASMGACRRCGRGKACPRGSN